MSKKPSTPFTVSHIKNSAVAKLNSHLFISDADLKPDVPMPVVNNQSISKTQLEDAVCRFCMENDLDFIREFTANKAYGSLRKFRFDMVIFEMKLIIEYEGLMSAKSRHTTVTGYSRDCDKYNEATVNEWKVLRYNTINYRNCIPDITKIKNTCTTI